MFVFLILTFHFLIDSSTNDLSGTRFHRNQSSLSSIRRLNSLKRFRKRKHNLIRSSDMFNSDGLNKLPFYKITIT